jgi:hypothetical protein
MYEDGTEAANAIRDFCERTYSGRWVCIVGGENLALSATILNNNAIKFSIGRRTVHVFQGISAPADQAKIKSCSYFSGIKT